MAILLSGYFSPTSCNFGECTMCTRKDFVLQISMPRPKMSCTSLQSSLVAEGGDFYVTKFCIHCCIRSPCTHTHSRTPSLVRAADLLVLVLENYLGKLVLLQMIP